MLTAIIKGFLFIGLPGSALYICIKLVTRKFSSLKKELVDLAMVLYGLIFAYLVWFDRGSVLEEQSYNLIPFQTITFYVEQLLHGSIRFSIFLINMVGNVVITTPIGLWLAYKRYPMHISLIAALGIPVLLEAGQIFLHHIGYVTRTVDIDDWILNFVGIAFGYIISKRTITDHH
ncbi:hypothetical protein Pryu01_01143 [Paraliobacillus ryukyuensis]|uniref:VanZ like protein n=1 Tax=Paraliobacillus ryukyuensis TaxID=200904 RepID=A0A366EFR1_9BACI|nr:VanZ family protein [Paraliobacillus ryukyuensis]RBP00285.1 VanZ like protein [Paraliobacillus ryukyuensis]